MSNLSIDHDLKQVRHFLLSSEWGKALQLTKQVVKTKPQDLGGRALLYSLFLFDAQYARAQIQLDVYYRLGGTKIPADYKNLANVLEIRNSSLKCPDSLVLGDLPTWFDDWSSLYTTKDKSTIVDQLLALNNEISASFSSMKAKVNDVFKTSITNLDTTLSYMFEFFYNGEYKLVPFSNIRELRLPQQPELFLDYLLLPARITLSDNQVCDGFIFTSYCNSHKAKDNLTKIGRSCSWDEDITDLNVGYGLQVFEADSEVFSIFDLSKLEFIEELENIND